MTPRDLLLALLVMAIWALNFPISKLAFAEFPPILFMAVRFALVALLICPFRRLPLAKLRPILLVSLTLGTFHFSLMFSGLSRTDAGTAALLVQSQVPFAALLAVFVFKDRVTPRMLAGMLIAFLGVGLIAGEPRFDGDPWPALMILAAAFAWAVANIQFKSIGAIDGFALSGWMAFFAAPQLLLLSLVLERHQLIALTNAGWRGWGGIAFGAVIVTIISYGMWYPLMRRYPVNQIMPFTLLVPALAVAASYVILGERLDAQALLGGAATLAGVAVIVLRGKPAAAR
ncbi:MAG: EamA family transporter [Alphaproteobacteria bacterium]|nr:EamA family transporter [Alphaproteobacteria bacterium]